MSGLEPALLDFAADAPAWRANGALEARVEAWCRAALMAAALPADRASMSVLLTDDAAMRALNRQFRGVDAPTNVLAWPAVGRVRPMSAEDLETVRGPAPRAFLGDVALGYEIVAAEAEAAGAPLEQRLSHLIVHGVLHLLGYDHETDEDAALMEARETAALASLGLPDPYAGGSTAPTEER